MQLQAVIRTLNYSLTTAAAMCYALVLVPRRVGRLWTNVAAAVCMGVIVVLNSLCFIYFYEDPEQSNIFLVTTLVEALLFQGTVLLLARYRDGRTLFAGVTASTFAALSQTAGDITFTFSGSIAVGMAVSGLLMVGLLVVCKRFIRKPYQRFFETNAPLFHWLFVLPALFYAGLYLTCYWPRSITHEPLNIPACIVLMVLIILSYSLEFSLLNYELETSSSIQRAGLMEAYAKGLESQNRDLKEYKLQGRIVRHDLRHYLGALTTLLAEGHAEEAKELLATLSASVSEDRSADYCANVIVNSVLYLPLRQAKEDGDRLDIHLDIPEELGRLNSTDLACVLANLVENAVHAVAELPQGERWITFHARCQKEQLMVTVRNPYAGEVHKDAATGLPKSSGGDGHGFGMRSIAAFVEHNQAVLDMQTADQIFAVRLLLRL